MKPTDNKSLLHFVFHQMDKLEDKIIDVGEATAQAALARQAHNCLNYERQRAETLFKLRGTGIEIREIENDSELKTDAEIIIKVAAVKK